MNTPISTGSWRSVFGRLDEAQQRVVLAAVRSGEGEAGRLGDVLERWSRDPEVPLAIRLEALDTLQAAGHPVDAGYLEALRAAAEVARRLDAEEEPELDDAEMLAAPLDAEVRALPVPLAVDVARQAAGRRPGARAGAPADPAAAGRGGRSWRPG